MEIYYSTNYIKRLGKLPQPVQQKIRQAVDNLVNWPNIHNVISIVSQSGYRLRIGRYSVLFVVADNIISVNDVKIRNEKTY